MPQMFGRLMTIKLLSGQVSATRGSISVEGSERVTTTQILTFRIRNREVQIRGGWTISVEDGDWVTVCGSEKDGIIYPIVYRNDVTGVVRSDSTVPGYIFGVICSLTALILLGNVLDKPDSYGLLFVLILFGFLAVLFYKLSRRIVRARNLLNQTPPINS